MRNVTRAPLEPKKERKLLVMAENNKVHFWSVDQSTQGGNEERRTEDRRKEERRNGGTEERWNVGT